MNPIQPVEYDSDGVIRFKKNKLVEYLLDNGSIDMNQLAIEFCGEEHADDREQFAQLIGYSCVGFATLSYVRDETWEKVENLVEQLKSESGSIPQY